MNKIIKAIAFVALMAAFSFSQEQEQESKIKFGGRAAYLFGEDMDGFAVGAVASLKITRFIKFNSELNFIRRTLHIPRMISCDGYPESCFWILKTDLTEFALDIPAQIQFILPLGPIALSAESGLELGIPLTKGEIQLEKNNPYNPPTDDRAALDIGLPVGVGLYIGKHFMLGVRFTANVTRIGDWVKTSLNKAEYNMMYLL